MSAVAASDARVESPRARRYHLQLCRHLDHKAREHPEIGVRVVWSETDGIVSAGSGRCVMQVSADRIALRAEALDEENLQRIQEIVGGHLERFGQRDHVEVNWQPV